MKTRLPNTYKTAQYLGSLPKMYIVGCWAGYGVEGFSWSGKWEKNPRTGHMEPLVWKYYDANGECDIWILVPIHQVTSGAIITWTEDKEMAYRIAYALNVYQTLKSKK